MVIYTGIQIAKEETHKKDIIQDPIIAGQKLSKHSDTIGVKYVIWHNYGYIRPLPLLHVLHIDLTLFPNWTQY